jgi:homocysteine S-methyltransferase
MRRVSSIDNPLSPFLEYQGLLILDGGLATELEARGADLSDELWSARVLMEDPGQIREVHRDYLLAGADCIASASYQATIEGFVSRGMTERQAEALLVRSVTLARQARDDFWAQPGNRGRRLRPLVAASIGPYGAFLADGSEFRGDYDLSTAELERFHRRRWNILASCGADLLACETLPSRGEALALRGLLEQTPATVAWFSFSCRDSECISDGTAIEVVAEDLQDCPQIVALGINCTSPRFILDLVRALRRATDRPIVVYPNSGEGWDADARSWIAAGRDALALDGAGQLWFHAGARLLGGCCRTGPAQISALRRRLLG